MSCSSNTESSACFVCHQSRKQRLCQCCVQGFASNQCLIPGCTLASERHKNLQAELEALIQAQERDRVQQSSLSRARERLAKAQSSLKDLQEQKHRVSDEASQLRLQLAKRRSDLQSRTAQKQLANARLTNGQMRVLEGRKILEDLLSDRLAPEMRTCVGTLMDILPLSSGHSHQRRRPVFISGFQLPVEMAGPPPARQQERCSAALGYMVLLLDRLSSILDTPLLTHLHYEGSTSSLGVSRSFWEDNCCQIFKLHLFHNEGPAAGSEAAGKQGTSSNKWQQRMPWETKFRSNKPPSMAREITDPRQIDDYNAALLLLNREIGVLSSGNPSFVVQDSLFSSISDFCWQIAMRPRSDAAGASSELGASALLRQPYSSANPHLSITENAPEEVDGWNLIQRPFQPSTGPGLMDSQMAVNLVMPPPPSDAEEVIKHWETANFPRSSGYLATYLRPQAITRHVNPLRQTAFAAADKWLQRFRTSNT